MKKLIRILTPIFAVLVVFAAGFAMSHIIGVLGHIIMATTPFAAAGEVVTDPVDTINDNPSLLQPDISKTVSLLQPDKFPMDTVLRNLGIVEPASQFEFSYFEVDQRPLQDTIKTELTATGTTSAANTAFDIVPNGLFIWNIDDHILFPTINGSDSLPLVLKVVNKTTTQLVVQALNGLGSGAADIPALAVNTPMTRMSNSKNENAVQTTPYMVLPQEQTNYCQIHMAQVEQGFYDKLVKKWAAYDLPEFRSAAIWDMRGQMEMASLFGFGGKFYNSVAGTYSYASNGAIRYITNVIDETGVGTFSDAALVDISKKIFTGNNGSVLRVMFAGSGALATMSGSSSYVRQIDQRDPLVKWGVTFNQVETKFGQLLVKYHPLLDYCGYTNNAIVFDMNNVVRKVLKPMATDTINFKESGQRNTTADILSEAFGLKFPNPDTHAIIKFA